MSDSPFTLPDNLSASARTMLMSVPEIGDELNHNYVGDEHVLIALSRQHGETPQIIFARYFGRSSEQVFEAVVHVSGRPQRGSRSFDQPGARVRTPDFKAVVTASVKIAEARGLTEVGLVDILIALTQFWHARSYVALEKLGVTPRELAQIAWGMK